MKDTKSINDRLKSNPLITIVIALIGSGIVGYSFNYIASKNDREDNYIQKYVETVEECQDQIRKLEKRLTVVENGLLDLPFPSWLKDRESNIIWINRAYVDQILKPSGLDETDLLGQKGECFGEDFLDLILKNDKEVLAKNKIIAFPEEVPGVGKGVSYKFPIETKFGGVTGVGGIWIPYDIKKALKNRIDLK